MSLSNKKRNSEMFFIALAILIIIMGFMFISPRFTSFAAYENGLIDRIEWLVPHLSNQTYDIDITILNIQSYPALEGNWTVMFNTTGQANLTIGSVEGTTGYSAEDDLEFLELKCGSSIFVPIVSENRIFAENYECSNTSYHTVKVHTTGNHTQKFTFGNLIAYAYNDVVEYNCTPTNTTNWIISTPVNCTDRVITMSANISITPSGELTFYNVTLIMNGTFNGNVVINNSGSFIVNNSNITAGNTSGSANYEWWNLPGSYLELENNDINYLGYNDAVSPYRGRGLFINTNDSIIKDNTITTAAETTNNYGVYLYDAKNNTIVGNTINSSKASSSTTTNRVIYLSSSDDNNISNNFVYSYSRDSSCIYLLDSSSNDIMNNTISSTQYQAYGIYIGSSSNDTVIGDNNIVTSGGVGRGIYIFTSSNNTLNNNTITTSSYDKAYGIDLASSSFNNLTNNNITTSNNRGLVVTGSSKDNFNNTVNTSNIVDSKPLHYYFNVRDKVIDNNDNIGEIYFAFSDNITIKNCNLTDFDGIYFVNTTNSAISNNTITTYHAYSIAVSFSSSENNTINDSTIWSTGNYANAVSFSSSSDNTIKNNTIKTAAYGSYAFSLESSSNNNQIEDSVINVTTTGGGSFTRGLLLSSSLNNSIINSIVDSYRDEDIYIAGTGTNYLRNSTFNKSDVVFASGSNASLVVQYYLDANVTDVNGNVIASVNVRGYNNTDDVVFSELTGSSGNISRQTLTEYTQNASGDYSAANANFSFEAPYVIDAVYGQADRAWQSVKMNESEEITLELKCAPPWNNSAWIIDYNLNCSDQTILLNQNMTIEPYANVTFDNITLIINASANGQFVINNSGNFVVNNSNITAGNTSGSANYEWWNLPGSYFYIDFTSITYLGYSGGSDYAPNHGLYINTNNSIIKNSVLNFSGAYRALTFVNAFNSTIENNSFYTNINNGKSIMMTGSSNNTIYKNTFVAGAIYSPTFNLYSSSDYNTISNNTVTNTGGGTWQNIVQNSEGNKIIFNQLYARELLIQNSPYTNITGNNFSSLSIDVDGSAIEHFNITIAQDNLFLGSPIYYYFNNDSMIFEDLTDIGELIIAWSDNVTVRNNTFTNGGIDFVFVFNSSIEGNNLTGYGINLAESQDNNISRNNINKTNYGDGIDIVDNSDFNKIISNTISTNCASCYSVYLDSVNNITMLNTTISNTQLSNNNLIRITSSHNMTIKDCTLIRPGPDSLPLGASTADFINTFVNLDTGFSLSGTGSYNFVNTTFNKSKIIFASGSSAVVANQYYLDINVTDANGNGIANANVTGYNNTNDTIFSELTGSAGNISRQTLTEYTQNASGNYSAANINFSFQSPYTINASHSLYETETQTAIINQSRAITFAMGGIDSCRKLNTSNKIYKLTQNVASNETCFNITANNITLDCQGFEINYSANGSLGYGIYSDSYNKTKIRNCEINGGSSAATYSYAIYLYSSYNAEIDNNSIYTTGAYGHPVFIEGGRDNIIANNYGKSSTGGLFAGRGILLQNTDNNRIINNTLYSTGAMPYALHIDSSDNNYIYNNNISIGRDDKSGAGIYLSSSLNNTIINATFSYDTCHYLVISGTAVEHYIHRIENATANNSRPIYYSHNIDNLQFLNEDTYDEYLIVNATNITMQNITSQCPVIFRYIKDSVLDSSSISINRSSRTAVRVFYCDTCDNVNITNNVLYSESQQADVISFYSSNNTKILNNNITTDLLSTWPGWGIYLDDVYKADIQTNRIKSISNYGKGIYLGGSRNVTVDDLFINITGTIQQYGVWLYESSRDNTFTDVRAYGIADTYPLTRFNDAYNNTFYDSFISSLNNPDIDVYGSGANYLINTTFNQSDIGFDASATGSLNISYYLDIYAKHYGGSAFTGVFVNTSDTNSLLNSSLVDSNGHIHHQLLRFFINRTNQTNYYPFNATAYNLSGSYYQQQSNSTNLSESETFIFYFEEEQADAQVYITNLTVSDLVGGTYKNLTINITLINSYRASLINPYVESISLSSPFTAAFLLQSCNTTSPLQNCTSIYNVTIDGSANPDAYYLSWKINWTNNDNTTTSSTEQSKVTVAGNPGIDIDIPSINLTENISSTQTYTLNISNTGNEHLSDAPSEYVPLTITGMDSAWFDFYSAKAESEGRWDAANNRFTMLLKADYYDLIFNITVSNFTPNVYYGNLTVTGTPSSGTVNDTLEILINVSPNIYSIPNQTHAVNHKTNTTNYILINNTGNTKLTYVTISESGDGCQFLAYDNNTGNITEQTSYNVSINITVPEFQDPGDYLCILNISSANPLSSITNFTVQVLSLGSWYFSPLANQSNSFTLNEQGQVANYTMHNIGNIPMNFSIAYDKTITNADLETCQNEFSPDCLGNIHNATYNPQSLYIDKNSSAQFVIWTVGDDESHTNITVKITMSNSSATPAANDTYVFITTTNLAPTIIELIRLDKEGNYNSTELYKNITFEARVGDDEVNKINQTSAYFNMTVGANAYKRYGTYSAYTPTGYYGGAKFTLEFNETNVTGAANVTFFVEDITNNYDTGTYNFDIIGDTNFSYSTGAPHATQISLNRSENVTLTVSPNNIGLAHAYNMTINSTDLPSFITTNSRQIADLPQGTTAANLTVTIANNTSPGTYYFNVTFNYTNPDNSTNFDKRQASVIVDLNEEYTVQGFSTGKIFNVEHNQDNIFLFNISAVGNGLTSVTVSNYSQESGFAITFSDDNISYYSDLGVDVPLSNTSALFMKVRPVKGKSPANYQFTVRITDPLDDYVMNLTVTSDYTWSVSVSGLNLSTVANYSYLDQQVIIFNDANNPLSFSSNLSGNITNFTDLGGFGMVLVQDTVSNLAVLGNSTVQLNYTVPDVSGDFDGNLTIQRTSGPNQENITIPINLHSSRYVVGLSDVQINNPVLSGDSINLSANLTWDGVYVSENLSFSVAVGGSECVITSYAPVGNKTSINCTLPSLTDASYYNVVVTANYSSLAGYVYPYSTLANAVFYRDMTSPVIHSANASSVYQNNLTEIYANITDNYLIENVSIILYLPNSSSINLNFSQKSGFYYANYSDTSLVGLHNVLIFVNDTENNNATASIYFEVYNTSLFAGQLVDLQSDVVDVNFTLYSTYGNYTFAFETNATGNYNATLQRRIYDANIMFDIYNISLYNQSFINLDSDFIDIDRLTYTDISDELVGAITGFSTVSDMSSPGLLKMDYTIYLDPLNPTLITSEDNLLVYQCIEYNFTEKNCIGPWELKTSAEIYKVSNYILADFDNFSSGRSAFALTEIIQSELRRLNVPYPNMTVYLNHSSTPTISLRVENTGKNVLEDIFLTCVGDCGWYVSSETISSIYGGSFDYLDIDLDIPFGVKPQNYTITFMINSSDTSQNTTYVSPNIVILADDSANVTVANTSMELGSNARQIITNLSVVNAGNVVENFTIVSNYTDGNIVVDETNFSLYRFESKSIPVTIYAPGGMGVYYYNLSVNNEHNFTFTVPVLKVAAIDAISPNSSLLAGQTISINASASDTGVDEANITWAVRIDSIECASTSYANNSIECVLPSFGNTTTTINKEVEIDGLINGVRAYDYVNVTYSDIFGPYILDLSSRSEIINRTSPITISESVYDDNGISNAVISLTMEDGSSVSISSSNINITNEMISFNHSFSERGDYVITYTLVDSLNNQRTQSKTLEVYEPTEFSGTIVGYNSNYFEDLIFKFKKWNTSDYETVEVDQFGKYNYSIHKRSYYKFIITIPSKTYIELSDIEFNESKDIINLTEVDGSTVSFSGTTERFDGIAAETPINGTGFLRIYYDSSEVNNPSDLAVYKCINWSINDNKCDSINWQYLASTIYSSYIEANITEFSAYLSAEGDMPSFVIGDGICSIFSGETYAVSPDDCDPGIYVYYSTTTSSTTSGGGGGGGGGGASVREIKSLLEGTEQKLIQSILEIKDLQIDPKEINRELYIGETTKTRIYLKNIGTKIMNISLSLSEEIKEFVSVELDRVVLNPEEEAIVDVFLQIPGDDVAGLAYGYISLATETEEARIPVEIRKLEAEGTQPSVKITLLQKNAYPNSKLKIQTEILYSRTAPEEFELFTQLIKTETNSIVLEQSKKYNISSNYVELIEIGIPKDIDLGEYFVRSILSWRDSSGRLRETSDSAPIYIEKESVTRTALTFLQKRVWFTRVWHILLFILTPLLLTGIHHGYKVHKEKKKKYHIPVDIKLLPQPNDRTGFIGMIAETNIRTFFDLDKLTSHALIAGSTGGGKTVSAQVLVEEALKKNIAVIVFDPTAQWTGFLRKCEDKYMLKSYSKFSMKRGDARAFNGNVHLVTNVREVVDIKNIAKPGEIHIFALNKMDLKDIDIFVSNTIRQVFKSNYKEYANLKLLLIYDEVHRLLPKYGGTGAGLLQMERACREFRKWGVGLVLISQVLSDFAGQIKANINTEVQVRTRDEGDLERLKTKYGVEILHTVVKASVGTGMLQNSAYNKGRPYIVDFRPLLHSVRRLSDKELNQYDHYNNKIEDINFEIMQLKQLGFDVFDFELELKLSLDKLKTGDFAVVDIYLDSLVPRIKDAWRKLKKIPKKRQKILVSEEEIQESIALAQLEHRKALEKPASPEVEVKTEEKPERLKKKEAEQPKTEPPEEAAAKTRYTAAKPSKPVLGRKTYKGIKSEKKVKKVKPEQKIVNEKFNIGNLSKKYKLVRNLLTKAEKKGLSVTPIKLKLMNVEGDMRIAKAKKGKGNMQKINASLDDLISRLQ